VFHHFFNNYLFISVFLLTFVVQMCMVEFGGQVVDTARLSFVHNVFCLIVGAGELIWGIFVKVIPIGLFSKCSLSD